MLAAVFLARAVIHYCEVIISEMASLITDVLIVYSTVSSCADQIKYQSSALLAYVRRIRIHRWSVNSPHKGPVTRKMSPSDDVIMECPSITVHPCQHNDIVLTDIRWQWIMFRASKLSPANVINTGHSPDYTTIVFSIWACGLGLALLSN